MGLMLPAELAEFLNLVGFTWPLADEEKLFAAGQRWIEFSGTLSEHAADASASAMKVLTDNEGEDLEAFRRQWEGKDGPPDQMRDAALAAMLIGIALIIGAIIVLVLKIMVIVQLILLAIQIFQAIATAAPTFGASLAEIPVFIAASRVIIRQLFKQALRALSRAAVRLFRHVIPRLLRKVVGSLPKQLRKKRPATGEELFYPGPWAKRSIPARNQGRRWLDEEKEAINRFGREDGCHSCSSKTSGRTSGNFTPDHQPVSTFVDDSVPQRLYPHCKSCSNDQGLEALNWKRRGKNPYNS